MPDTGQPEQPPTQHEAPTPQRPQDERTVEDPSTTQAAAGGRDRTDDRPPSPPTGQPIEPSTGQNPDRPARWGVSHPWRAVQLADGTHVDHHGARLTDAQVDEARELAEQHGMTLQQR